MSEDDPRYSDAEVEDEEESEEADTKSIASSMVGSQILRKRLQRTNSMRSTVASADLTEAEKALIALKSRQEDEDAAKLQDYEERRRTEREKEAEELRMLKEKQETRRQQREEEEREMAERRRVEEERRRAEDDERRARMETERLRKEEARRLKGLGVGSPAFVATPPVGSGGRNFVLPAVRRAGGGDDGGGGGGVFSSSDKFGNIVQAKQEMGMTKEQQDAAKVAYLAGVMRALPQLGGLLGSELKAKIKELHHRICKLETEKYDLEKRHERQEYDLKELNERQRQINRYNNKKKGLDPTDNTRFPPKISVISKYDRQIDRRNFGERRAMYDKKDAFPCFPNVPPPPSVMERIILPQEDGLMMMMNGVGGAHEHDDDYDEEDDDAE